MNRNRLLVLGVAATSIGVACLVACSDADPRAALVEEEDADAAPRPEASLPETRDAMTIDAGPDDADAEPPMPDVDLSDEPVVCATTPCVTQLVGSAGHFCARMSDGTVQCWGRNHMGSLGRGPDGGVSSAHPAPVVGIDDATEIASSAGSSASCARLADERVLCWGDNSSAQLGLTAATPTRDSLEHHTPTDVALSVPIAHVAIGPTNGCAVALDGGDLYCWGSNTNQLLARPDAATSGTNVWQGPGLAEREGFELTRISLGHKTAYGLTKTGRLVSWGATAGRQTSLSFTLPTEHPTPTDVMSVGSLGRQASEAVACAVARGRLYCWGKNSTSQLGTGIPDDERFPAEAIVEADENVFVQQVVVSQTHTCGRLTDGTVACSGSNAAGQIGAPSDVTSSPTFRRVPLQGHAVQVAVSVNATCALLENGEVHCWGGNTSGELGRGTVDTTITAHPDPAKVVFQ
jgi:alpha-tubulin suppressor-like RCC1 family protein